MKNKVLSVTLCAALIFTMLAQPQIQPPAQAEAVSLTATAIAVAVTLVVAAGVTWTSVAMGKQCTTQFLTDKPEARQIITDIVASMPQTGVLVITKTMLPKVKQFMQMVGEYFKGKTSVMVPDSQMVTFQGVSMYSQKIMAYLPGESTDDKYKRLYGMAQYSYNDYFTFHNVVPNGLSRKSDSFSFFLKDDATSPYGGTLHTLTFNSLDLYNSGAKMDRHFIFTDYYFDRSNVNYRFLFCFDDSMLPAYGYYRVFAYLYSRSSSGAYRYCEDSPLNSFYGFNVYPSDSGLSLGYNSIPLNTINIGNIDDINESIAHSVGQAAEGVKVDIQKLIEEIEAAKDEALPWTVEGVRELIGIQDELKEIAREQERIKEAIKEGTKEDDMNVPQLPSTITDKFPFCVPFDLIALANTFSAKPVAPKVTVPVVFESMHYSHDFVFDFSGDNWDKVAAVIRWGTLIFFILGLTMVTRKMIKG